MSTQPFETVLLEFDRELPPAEDVAALIGGRTEIRTVMIPADCRDIFIETSLEVSPHDFVHRCEVVDTLHRLHLELPILGAIRAAVLEPHA